jgi:hypothetical protein
LPDVHRFSEDLKYSKETDPWWEPFYPLAFPTLQSIVDVKGPCDAQQRGVDKYVFLKDGQKINLELKVRKERRPIEMGLEYVQHYKTGRRYAVGWINRIDSLTDILGYGFIKFNAAVFVPFAPLQKLWIKNSLRWSSYYKTFMSENDDYYAVNSCVLTSEILHSIPQAKLFTL